MHARETLVVNQREREALLRLAPEAKVRVIEIGVDFPGLRPDVTPVEAPRAVFCGVMNYAPNVQGVVWFVREVWPLVRVRYPTAEFVIVGADPADAIRRLASRETGITVTGTVADVRPYLWKSAVGIAPLKTARGVQNKVLESVAAGLPVVVTTPVFEGLPVEVRSACRLADSAADFARQLLELFALPAAERRRIATESNLGLLSWEQRLSPLFDVLKKAAAQ